MTLAGTDREPLSAGHVRTETAHIHFETYGDVTFSPLVVLHGNGEDLHSLDEQIRAFAARHWVVAIDTRGHGRSSGGTESWDFPLFSRDVLAVLDELNIDSTHVFGYSDGGNIALQLVSDHPQRVRSVAVVGANLDPTGLHPWTRAVLIVQRAALSIAARRSRRAAAALAKIVLMTDHPHLDPVRLRRPHIPALVIAGQRDVVRSGHTELIARSLPGSELHILRGAKHEIPFENAEQCNALVLDFLRTVDA
ncbi:pimeloyl-ACP methyl ester carboxylesterase [Hoyosella altamirensis]|uniref:Pimeloyl-ACP methyl ester carboxylesterase n=1 Tax=Hoyosella altamirensis TaxID=616997 RepID=A0A839RI82_9ACTN|nr:alpha/beta fold hydrolase [Hoyosella altamirensis]MBB3035761.1 pimeloyl-ACP methyl ester carboxylesterase [Hoyosella altamirensis]